MVTYDDRGSYDGAWQNCQRHRYSTYTWSDGRRHIGAWFAEWRAWARHTHRGQWGHQDRWLVRWHIYGRIDHQQDTIYTTYLPYNRRHMTNEICTNILRIIHNTQAIWAHTKRKHITYKMRRTYMLNTYVYTSVSQNMCRVSKERQDQLTLTPYEHQRGWQDRVLNMSLLLRTRVSEDDRVWGRDSILVTRERRDSNDNENRVLSINE